MEQIDSKTLLAFPRDVRESSAQIRLLEPINVAIQQQKINAQIQSFSNQNFSGSVDINFYSNKNLLMQRILFTQFDLLKIIRQHTNSKLIYDTDDLITHIPEHNQFKIQTSNDLPLLEIMRQTLNFFDIFTVSTPNLANFYNDLHKNIVVLPNRLDAEKWLPLCKKSIKKTSTNQKMRVGYAGYVSHQEDLKLISELVQQTYKQVDWIFFGDCRAEIRPFIKEYHDFVPMKDYPKKLASLDLDLAVIPLQDDLFNSCKSNLKVLQFGILGVPLIVSNIGAYEDSSGNCAEFPIYRINKNNKLNDWKNAILEHITNPQETLKQGKLLQIKVLEFGFIQNHIDDYVKIWLQ